MCETQECRDLTREVLAEMGYKQELYRGFSGFMSFAFCFNTVSCFLGSPGAGLCHAFASLASQSRELRRRCHSLHIPRFLLSHSAGGTCRDRVVVGHRRVVMNHLWLCYGRDHVSAAPTVSVVDLGAVCYAFRMPSESLRKPDRADQGNPTEPH